MRKCIYIIMKTFANCNRLLDYIKLMKIGGGGRQLLSMFVALILNICYHYENISQIILDKIYENCLINVTNK